MTLVLVYDKFGEADGAELFNENTVMAPELKLGSASSIDGFHQTALHGAAVDLVILNESLAQALGPVFARFAVCVKVAHCANIQLDCHRMAGNHQIVEMGTGRDE
jgi:hypothetical protein